MLSGVYGYLFGEENSNDSVCSQENVEPCSVSSSEDDWCIVDECNSGRSSPVLVPELEVQDIDTLSFCSKKSFKPMNDEQLKRSEELRAIRAATAQRMELERALFAEADPLNNSNKTNNLQRSVLKLKRPTATVTNDAKSKSKKKSVKTLNQPAKNSRKSQNLD